MKTEVAELVDYMKTAIKAVLKEFENAKTGYLWRAI